LQAAFSDHSNGLNLGFVARQRRAFISGIKAMKTSEMKQLGIDAAPDRFDGIEQPYSVADVQKPRGSVPIRYTRSLAANSRVLRTFFHPAVQRRDCFRFASVQYCQHVATESPSVPTVYRSARHHWCAPERMGVHGPCDGDGSGEDSYNRWHHRRDLPGRSGLGFFKQVVRAG
jgi:hypothetical protein